MALFGAAFAAMVAGAVWKHRHEPVLTTPNDIPPHILAAMQKGGMDMPRHLYPEPSDIDRLLGDIPAHSDFSGFKGLIDSSQDLRQQLRVFHILESALGRRRSDGLPGSLMGIREYLQGSIPRRSSGIYAVIVAPSDHPDARLDQRSNLPVCETPLDPRLARRIIAAWDKVVGETRPTPLIPYMGSTGGGASHFVSVLHPGVPMAGQMVFPPTPFKPGWLNRLASNLRQFCGQNDKEKVIAGIEQALRAIETAPRLR